MPVERESEGRINLRVDPNQEARLRAAAEANGESLAEFLLAAGAEQAEAVLEGTTRIALSATAFEQFVNALGAKPELMPNLRRYASEPGPIPAR